MYKLNPSASMRADNGDSSDNQGHCHNHILLLFPLFYSHYMSFQRNFGTKIYEIGSPFCAYVTAGGSCYINLKNAVAEAHIYSNKFMYKMSGHDICRPHDHASFSSCGYAHEP